MDDVYSSLKPVVKENIKNVKSDTETFIENAKENAKIAHESAHDIYGNLKENAKVAQENAHDMYGNLKENAKIAQENAHDMYGNLKENAKIAHESASDILENIKEKAHVAHDGASSIFGSIKENVKTAQENANDVMETVKEQLQQLKIKGQWTSDKAKQILDKAHHEALSQKLITEKEWKKAYASLESLYKPVPWYQRFFRAKPTPAEQINAKIDAFSHTLSDHIRHLGSLTKEQSQTIADQIRDSIDNADFEKLTDNEWVDSLTDILEKNTRFNKKDLKSSIDSLKSNYYEFKNDKLKYASSVLKDGMDYTGQAVKEGLDTASQVAKEGADSASGIAKEHYETVNKAAKGKFEEAKQEAKKQYDAANKAAKESYSEASQAAKKGYDSASHAAKEGYDSASQAAKDNLHSAEHEIKSSTFVDDVKTDWNNFWLGTKQKIFAIDDLFRRGWPLYHDDPQKTAQDKYRSAKYIVQSATQNWEDAAKTVADDLRDDWDASTQAAREGIYDQLHTVTETASHHQRKWGKAKDDAERKWKESKHAAEDRIHHQWNDAKEHAANLHDKWDKAKDHHASKIHHKWGEAKDHASDLHHKWDDSMEQAQERIHQWGNSHHEAKNLYNQHTDTTPDVLLDEDILPSDYADHIQTVYPIDRKPLNEVSPKQHPVDSSFAGFWKEKEAAIYNKLGYTDTHIDWIKTYLERTFENKKSPVCGKIDEAAIVIKRYLNNIKIESSCEIEKTVDMLKNHLESWRTTCYYN
jgi:hypothetical protein